MISGKLRWSDTSQTFNIADGSAAVDFELRGATNSTQGLVKNGDGLLAVTANNSATDPTVGIGYSGPTTINAGTYQLGDGGATGNLNPASAIVNNAVLAFKRSNTLTQGTDFNSVIMGPGSVVQAGTGTTILNGVNTYSGGTVVNAGTLQVASTGNINSSAGVTIAGGNFSYNGSIDYTRPIAFSGTGGTVSGVGRLAAALVVASGNTISPGNNPGILRTGDLTWATGGNYNWQMYDALGAAGTGFDQVAVTGSLIIESGFTLNLWSLSGINPDANGNAINFDNTQDRFWVIATSTAGPVNPENLASVNIFTSVINGTGGFSNDLGTRQFSLIQGDGVRGTPNDVVLVLTVPEPGTLVLAVTGAAVAAGVVRRRRVAVRRRG